MDAEQINARFHREPYTARFTVDGLLPDAAVLLHIFDEWEESTGNERIFWRAGSSRNNVIQRMSTSLIYADQRPSCCNDIGIPVFDKGFAGLQGLIFRPGITTRILCGSAGDRSSAPCSKWCESIPLEGDVFDPHHPGRGADGCAGAWRPQDFGVYLQRSCLWEKEVQAPWAGHVDYNEILIDGSHWNAHLPDAIEAFFGSGDLARQQHQRFLERYQLTASQVPLLTLDPHNWVAPFATRD